MISRIRLDGASETAPARSARGRMLVALLPHAVFSLAVCVGIAFMLHTTGGVAGYTLDDPYIHLALSNQIAHLHYGINSAEASSPSSSILWPILLAPTAGSRLHPFTPLILCWLASLASIEALRRLTGLMRLGRGALFVSLAVPLVFPWLLNLYGLIFTGMEHSLHVAFCLWVIIGLIQFHETGRASPWFVACLLIGPLVRYEGLGVTLAACCVVAMRQPTRRLAVGVAALSITTVAAFSVFLLGLHLDPLPSSVLVKLNELNMHSTGQESGLFKSICQKTLTLAGAGFATLAAIFGLRFAVGERADKPLAGFATAVLLGHIVLGHNGWFSRYEIYVLAMALCLACYLWRGAIDRLFEAHSPALAFVGLTAVVAPYCLPHLNTTVRTFRAIREINRMQYQMHRFETEFHQAPVAVNDLGWVTYQNPNYVLDLWGLGSQEARKSRVHAGGSPAFLERLTKAHRVDLAMIFEPWFAPTGLPSSWTRIGCLSIPADWRTVTDQEAVTFLAVDPADVEALSRELLAFGKTVPQGTKVVVLTEDWQRQVSRPNPCKTNSDPL
jgi:hypothetical protein